MITVYIDGACSGNPGPAGIGYIVYLDNDVLTKFSLPIGSATNNIAEWSALIAALEYLQQYRGHPTVIYSDSLLVVKQINDEWKVKDKDLARLYKLAKTYIKGLDCKVFFINREFNKEADILAQNSLLLEYEGDESSQ